MIVVTLPALAASVREVVCGWPLLCFRLYVHWGAEGGSFRRATTRVEERVAESGTSNGHKAFLSKKLMQLFYQKR